MNVCIPVFHFLLVLMVYTMGVLDHFSMEAPSPPHRPPAVFGLPSLWLLDHFSMASPPQRAVFGFTTTSPLCGPLFDESLAAAPACLGPILWGPPHPPWQAPYIGPDLMQSVRYLDPTLTSLRSQLLCQARKFC